MRSDRSNIIYNNDIRCTFPREFYHSSHGDMPLHVQCQMVRAREGPLTEPALERPVAGVLAVVASQLVRASELPAAAFPAALVRLLARVRAEVRLEVRRLGVRLAAPGVRARVRRHFLASPASSASFCLCGLRGDWLVSRDEGWRHGWRSMKVVRVVPEVGKMWR